MPSENIHADTARLLRELGHEDAAESVERYMANRNLLRLRDMIEALRRLQALRSFCR